MIYRKQHGYDDFRCIAGACPKSCCIGWQIVIDEESLRKYKKVDGEFAGRIAAGVDYAEGVFHQKATRCMMLNDAGLCDLQATMGEAYLCDTCRLYPRHIEEFQDLREYSLSLSCPEVVRMILDAGYTFGVEESEDEVADDPEEFEDFDFFIFDQLEYARDRMMEVLENREIPLWERMQRVAAAAFQLQGCYDDGDVLGMGDVEYDISGDSDGGLAPGVAGGVDYCMEQLEVLAGMEVLETDWTEGIVAAKRYWMGLGDGSAEWASLITPGPELSVIFEKICMSLLFTYFCGAVYDGQIYARAMIALQSVRNLMLLYGAGDEALAKVIYLYSREVEHSDLNVNRMIEVFEGELE